MNPHPTVEQLHALAVQQQREFDRISEIYGARMARQLARRQRMRETLVAHETAMQAFLANGSDVLSEPRQPTPAEREHTLKLLEQFDADAKAYVQELHEGFQQFAAMRDALAAFMRTRDQLRALGHAAPEVIHHHDFAARLQTAAFDANCRRADPGHN